MSTCVTLAVTTCGTGGTGAWCGEGAGGWSSVLIQRQIPGLMQGRLICKSCSDCSPAAYMQAVCRLTVRVF